MATNDRKNSQLKKQSTHITRKRPPVKFEEKDSVIYVSSKANIKGLIEKCEKLMRGSEEEVVVYCLGAAIQQGMLLVLRLCEKYPGYVVSPKTFTTEVTDDLEPIVDDVDYETLNRSKSALQIVIRRSTTP